MPLRTGHASRKARLVRPIAAIRNALQIRRHAHSGPKSWLDAGFIWNIYSLSRTNTAREMGGRCLFSLQRLRAIAAAAAWNGPFLNWNEPAIKFYRALGTKPMDEWTVFRLTRDEIARLANSE